MEIEDNKELLELNLDLLLELLGNQTRRLILSKLAKVPHSTSELHKALGISRQAVHSQLKILQEYNLIEKIDLESRGGKYRIKSNLSMHIDISPDFYNINYNITNLEPTSEAMILKDAQDSSKYKKIENPNEKIKFLGKKIMNLEENISEIEQKRQELLQKKECFIIQLKDIMENQYKKKLTVKQEERLNNLEEEIFYTLFFNLERYHNRIDLDYLLEDMFFSDIEDINRATHKTSIDYLLKDLSRVMDFLRKEGNKWFFDI
ncbi:MAG: helix-turn-helix domain-containing protein [Candidatus Lokiarchaeota archaeon]|nr:helix-turn-helix domain-containing protein [Candidatus Lokiarchaeota archaeon]MBD3199978.1 helix-turn-helix domain-containing protein [Candidatus Lokiarchaeota archaeon]